MLNKTINKKTSYLLTTIKAISLVFMFVALSNKAFADCESNGAYGQNCTYTKEFEIDKHVRKIGDDDWHDKITGIDEGEKFEFKITVKNVGEVEVDSMKMTDFLPDEIERISGDELVQYWQDFEPDESKKFIFEARVRSVEYDKKNFEKCVVNKAEAYYSDDEVGSATAVVCYGDSEPKELPKTGPIANGLIGFGGLISLGLGLSLKLASTKRS